MDRKVAFLRGVNMTGHNTIRMTELADMFKKAGFKDALTYIQSGNVVFSDHGEPDEARIEQIIGKALNKRFGYDISVMVRGSGDLKRILLDDPFISPGDYSDSAHHAVIFLKELPSADQLKKLDGVDYPPDKFGISGKEIYIWCPNGFGKTKLYTNFFENRLKIKGTARNLKTINNLIELSGAQ